MKSYNVHEYFDHLKEKKIYKVEDKIGREDFHNALVSDKYGFTAEETNHLFDLLDANKDGYIDRNEWVAKVRSIHDPLFRIQDIIKTYELDIEDIIHRLDISTEKNEKFDLTNFKNKLRKLHQTMDSNYIISIYHALKNSEGLVESKDIIKHFNVFKKENFRSLNNESFSKNFKEYMTKSSNYYQAKELFEEADSFNNGLLDKVTFCRAISKINTEFKDDEVMKYLRINNLYSNNKVNYPAFLDLVFYDFTSNKFIHIVEQLKNDLNKCSIADFIKQVSGGSILTINDLHRYLETKLGKIDKKIVCKVDIDQDGVINENDLDSLIKRFTSTSYFKHENDEKGVEVKIYPKEKVTDSKFKQIVQDVKKAIKNHNITLTGLFNKLDTNKDGFVSGPEFSANIDSVLSLAPAIKDKFYNYLDVRGLGIVDLDTFLKTFKEFKSEDVIIRNNWDFEKTALNKVNEFIKKNCRLTPNEIFALIDKDFDGMIDVEDMTNFLVEKLNFSGSEINPIKVERLIQNISLTKTKNLGMIDITEYVKRERSGQNVNLLKLTKNTGNLASDKDDDWIETALQKLGLYLTSKFGSLEEFFSKVGGFKGKIRIEDFRDFCLHYPDCVQGMNLTYDEVITIFASLDSQKKSYLSLNDLNYKLGDFEFYNKMHRDIKTFIVNNFGNSRESFKFFVKPEAKNSLLDTKSELVKWTLSKKELFDGIQTLFTGKFTTNNLNTYLAAKFKDVNCVSFSEFNFLYFDAVDKNEKLYDGLSKTEGENMNKQRSKSVKEELKTPYDEDPLEKVRRLFNYSKVDGLNLLKMHDLVNDGFINQNEFRNLLKKLNLGLTSLEIDNMIAKLNKTKDGKLNLKEFIKFVSRQDPNLEQMANNINKFLSVVKQLLYKYYSNPRLAFQRVLY